MKHPGNLMWNRGLKLTSKNRQVNMIGCVWWPDWNGTPSVCARQLEYNQGRQHYFKTSTANIPWYENARVLFDPR